MGKGNNEVKEGKKVDPDSFAGSMRGLEEQRKELEKRAAKLKAKCSHKGNSGKLKLNSLKGSKVVCDKCGEVFDLNVIGQENLENAIEVVHNALQQVRCMTRTDKESDVELCQIYGNIDFNVKNLGTVYAKLNNKVGNGKSKHKKERNEHGFYGNKVSFLGK